MFDVLLITGAAGSGKTTTAREWAATRSATTAHLSHDAVTLFVQSGFASAAHPTAEGERQWRIGIDVCVAAARVYAKAGVRCAIDTFLLPVHGELWRDLAPLRVGLVVLQPHVELAVTRNATRLEQNGWGVPEWQVRANHAAMEAWRTDARPFILDTSALALPEVIAAIDAWERSGDCMPLL